MAAAAARRAAPCASTKGFAVKKTRENDQRRSRLTYTNYAWHTMHCLIEEITPYKNQTEVEAIWGILAESVASFSVWPWIIITDKTTTLVATTSNGFDFRLKKYQYNVNKDCFETNVPL